MFVIIFLPTPLDCCMSTDLALVSGQYTSPDGLTAQDDGVLCDGGLLGKLDGDRGRGGGGGGD